MPELNPLSFPLHGSRLIEASAGTGKTYTLAFLYLRLVLGTLPAGARSGEGAPSAENSPSAATPPSAGPAGPGLTPPEILTLTFTKAATQELRERIRQRLSETAAFFDGQRASKDPLLLSLHVQIPDLPLAAARLRQAAEAMDAAAIHTIHAWCYQMLREHAFSSGSLLRQKIISETEARELQAQAVRDYWRQHAYALPPDAARKLEGCFSGPAALEAMLAELLKKPRARLLAAGAEISPPASLAAALAGDDACLPRVLAHALTEVSRLLAREKSRRGLLSNDDLLLHLQAALAGARGEALASRIRAQFPVALIDEFQDTDPVQYDIFYRIYRDAFASPGEAPAQAEAQLALALTAASPRLGLFMIGDPKQAIYAFRGADIYAYLKARTDVGADPYTLTTNFRSTQTLVGAVNRCFAAAEASPAGAFRFRRESGNPVPFLPARSVQEAFPREAWPSDLKQELIVDGKAQPALTFAELVSEAPIGITALRSQIAAQCAHRIAAWLGLAAQGRAGFRTVDDNAVCTPLAARDIAVLVRDGKEAEQIRLALARKGVKSVYLSMRDSVFATPEARDVLACLQASAEPNDDALRRAALACSSLQQDWATLEAHNRDEDVREKFVARFSDYRRIWRQQGPLPMLRRLITEFGLPARLLSLPDGERRLTNLLHLAEWLQQEAQMQDGEQALLRRYAGMLDEPSDEENVLRLESEEKLVRIVTIHKSKGLQYPIVMLPFVADWKEIDGHAKIVAVHDDSAEHRLGLELAGKKNAGESYAKADEERLSEDVRLLYVALTRAQFALWVGIAPLKHGTAKAMQLEKGALGFLLGCVAGEKDVTLLEKRLAALQGDGIVVERLRDVAADDASPRLEIAATPSPQPARVASRALDAQRWWVASFSALTERLAQSDAPEGERRLLPEAPETPGDDKFWEVWNQAEASGGREPPRLPSAGLHGLPGGAQVGDLLHGVLEWAAATGFAEAARPERHLELIRRRCALWGRADWAAVLSRWLPGFLQGQVELPEAPPFSLAGLSRYRAEMEFWFRVGLADVARVDAVVTAHTLGGEARPHLQGPQLQGMLKGFIDLVFEHAGRYYIADYKSNRLGETAAAYTPERVRAAMLAHRYDLQYALYVFALHRLLRSRLGEAYDYERQVGGAVYLFLRGGQRGVFFERPPFALIEALERVLS